MDETEIELTESQFDPGADPFSLFSAWFKDAEASEVNDPNAMSVATVDPDGMPNVRITLLKSVDARGFVFYTNFESVKGRELLESGKVALCWHWKSLRRQVRVRGSAVQVPDDEADSYFQTRARGSQIGAWASQQSRPLESRLALEKAIALTTATYPFGTIPRPPHWSGFRVVPVEIEFWHDRKFRLHDRFRFTRENPNSPWIKTRLYP